MDVNGGGFGWFWYVSVPLRGHEAVLKQTLEVRPWMHFLNLKDKGH